MNCRDFDQTWNRLLDAESGRRRDDEAEARSALEVELRRHAESCPSCLQKHQRFEAFRAALRAWSDHPRPVATVTPAAVDRIVDAASEAAPASSSPLRWAWVSGLAAAAALGVVLLHPADAPRDGTGETASLSLAVADARLASWRLAQTASEPAARIGLAMLDASLIGDVEPDAAVPTDDRGDAEPDPLELVSRVGGYAAAGARPLSDAARRAFGFLRPPTIDKNAAAASSRGI